MRPKTYKLKWEEINKSKNYFFIEHLTRQIALSFIDKYLHNGIYEEKYIELLCEIAINDDDKISDFASKALFGIIIESLCDDFEDMQTETYNLVMTNIISYLRNNEKGQILDKMLKAFDIHSSFDLLDRIETVRFKNNKTRVYPSFKKIFILSRITIGADIAITSVIIQRMMKLFPNAEIVIAGTDKLKSIFGGNKKIKIREIKYSRRGNIFDKFGSWLQLIKIIEEEKHNYSSDDFLIIDPDSRLSQLGLLPLSKLNNYYYFNSREYVPLKGNISMPVITNKWIDKVFGINDFSYPNVWLKDDDIKNVENFIKPLKNSNLKLIAINFGVGGNYRKKVPDYFEEKLLLKILQTPNTLIILDKGFGDEELTNSNNLILKISEQGFFTNHASLKKPIKDNISSGIIGIECSIGEMGAIITLCDKFIGYDSACQHLSSAIGTKTLTIFAGSNNSRFVRRWTAFGKGKCELIHVDTLTDSNNLNIDEIVERVLDCDLNDE